MKATLLVLPRADEDVKDLPPRDLRRVVETMEFLCDFPLAAQTAGLPEAPDVRRAVAGKHLIYYRYDPRRNAVLVYTVRHGRQKPPDVTDVVPQ